MRKRIFLSIAMVFLITLNCLAQDNRYHLNPDNNRYDPTSLLQSIEQNANEQEQDLRRREQQQYQNYQPSQNYNHYSNTNASSTHNKIYSENDYYSFMFKEDIEFISFIEKGIQESVYNVAAGVMYMHKSFNHAYLVYKSNPNIVISKKDAEIYNKYHEMFKDFIPDMHDLKLDFPDGVYKFDMEIYSVFHRYITVSWGLEDKEYEKYDKATLISIYRKLINEAYYIIYHIDLSTYNNTSDEEYFKAQWDWAYSHLKHVDEKLRILENE
jgi:hypothetical protein